MLHLLVTLKQVVFQKAEKEDFNRMTELLNTKEFTKIKEDLQKSTPKKSTTPLTTSI